MFIEVKGTQLHYNISGSGSVVVWLHGFLEDKEIWKSQTSYFDAEYTNICIDLPGHGKSGVLGNVHSMELMASLVQKVIKKEAISQFAVVGHSMGGYVAMALLQQIPHKITHLVLLNSTSRADTSQKKQNRDRAIQLVQHNKANFVRMGIVNLFSNTNRALFISQIETLINSAQKISEKGITQALLGMKNRTSTTELLAAFKGKKMLVAGKQDAILDYNLLLEEAKFANVQLLTLQGGHMSYMEATEELNKSLYAFF